MEFNNKNLKGIIVLDVDDVVLYTTSLWFDRLMKSKKLLPYLNEKMLPKDYSYEKNFLYNYGRPEYLFNCFLRPDLNKEEKEFATIEIMKLYLENNFYKDPKLYETNISRSIKIAAQLNSSGIEKILVVTRTLKETKKDKIDKLKEIFYPIMDKIDLYFVDKNEKKSDVINELNKEDQRKISLIADDELKNIYDYIDNTDITEVTFLIPETNYNNKFNDDYKEKAKERNISIVYYDYFNFN